MKYYQLDQFVNAPSSVTPTVTITWNISNGQWINISWIITTAGTTTEDRSLSTNTKDFTLSGPMRRRIATPTASRGTVTLTYTYTNPDVNKYISVSPIRFTLVKR